MKVLILTLYSGEGEYIKCIESLHGQKYKSWEHRVFSNLPSKTAHVKLYAEIMARSAEFDLFIKLDADMVFLRNTALGEIVNFFEERQWVHQANFAVKDFASRSNIMGLLVFRNTAYWEHSEETLFVDTTPKIDGYRVLVWGKPSPLVSHAAHPHPYESFHFGAHRALKATQMGRLSKNRIQSSVQWLLLLKVWMVYFLMRDASRRWTLLGVRAALLKQIPLSANNYDDKQTKEVFSSYNLKNEIENTRSALGLGAKLISNNMKGCLLWPQLSFYKICCRLQLFRLEYLAKK